MLVCTRIWHNIMDSENTQEQNEKNRIIFAVCL